MREFTKSDWWGFGGAENFPSGASPIIGECKVLISEKDTGESIPLDAQIVVSGTGDKENVILVGIYGVLPDEIKDFGDLKRKRGWSHTEKDWYLLWTFECEDDARRFAQMVEGGLFFLKSLLVLGGKDR
jgi:hypothetical protein